MTPTPGAVECNLPQRSGPGLHVAADHVTSSGIMDYNLNDRFLQTYSNYLFLYTSILKVQKSDFLDFCFSLLPKCLLTKVRGRVLATVTPCLFWSVLSDERIYAYNARVQTQICHLETFIIIIINWVY